MATCLFKFMYVHVFDLCTFVVLINICMNKCLHIKNVCVSGDINLTGAAQKAELLQQSSGDVLIKNTDPHNHKNL